MSSEFQPRHLPYDPSIATSHRRLYSTILAEFPWYSDSLVLKPQSLLAHSDKLPAFKSFLSSLHGFEDTLLNFTDHSRMKDILGLLGIVVVITTGPEPSCLIRASHEPTLSLYEYQKLCSVLCAYRFFEIISLQAQCVSRIPVSTPTACMFLPGPPNPHSDLFGFSRLQDWPKLVMGFRDLVQKAPDRPSPIPEFRNAMFSLMQMVAKNNFTTKYLAIEENFLLAAIHVAAMKDIPFVKGTLPDLPADMLSTPPGGFQDKESGDHLESEYNKFIEKCKTEGCPLSAAPVSSRSPFQLAVMLSPLYLLSTFRLSKKSFHRRTVIDLAARLGPHKPPSILAVENVIWDAIFSLSEGRLSVYQVLRNLSNSLPWSDIDAASNADQQWFKPASPMQYPPSTSFPQSTGPFHLIAPSSSLTSVTDSLSSMQSAQPYADFTTIPSLLTPHMDQARIIPISLPSSSVCNAQQQRLLLPPPSVYASSVWSSTATSLPSQTWPTQHISESIPATQSNSSPPQCSPPRSSQLKPLNPSPGDLEAQAVHKVASPIEDEDRNSFANGVAENPNTASAGAPPGDSQHPVNPLRLTLQSTGLSPLHNSPNLDFDPINSDPAGATSNSESSSDSDSTLGNMEIDRDEPHGVQPAAHGQGEGDGFATLHSDFMGSGSDGLDEPRPIAKDPDDDYGARSSFANSLAKTLNATFTGTPPRSHSVQHTVNPLQLTVQPTGSSPLHNSPNLDFDPIDTDPAGSRSDSESSSDSSSDSDSTSDNMDIDSDEPDWARSGANAQSEGDGPETRNESGFMGSDSYGPDVPQPIVQDPHDSHLNGRLTGNDFDPTTDSGSSDDGSDYDMPTGKLTGRSPQGSSEDPNTTTPPTGDDIYLKKPTQSSGAGDPDASTKRRRSSSPVFPRELGTKYTPIDVDKVTSLFEPTVIREYVKKEEISIPLETTPLVKGDMSYTVFDVTGEPKALTPSFHFKVYHDRFRQFFDRVKAFYEHGQPLHIARPGDSVIKSFAYEEWKALTSVQMQEELRKKNVIVTGWPLKEKISFDEEGLRKVAGTQSRQISINDYSIKPAGNGCLPTVVSGRVRDMWDNRHPSGKILNALDLPLYDGNTEPTEYASDLHAWDVTRGHHHVDQASSYPTEHMRWALLGHEHAITFLHIDCEGLGTDLLVADGGKVWGFLRERLGNPVSSINFFLKDTFRLDEVLDLSDYDFEAVALRPRDRLFMMPCQPHFVFGYAHTICLGGHYYLSNQMQQTLRGLIHSFILHKFLTNTSHPTRILLRRMILFYHMGLLEDEIPESDPAASHLPNVKDIDGLMNLLSACVLVILGNVLDFRTYRAPSQEEYTKADENQQTLIDNEINTIPVNERLAICYARGVALRLVNWICHCSVITGPGGAIIDDLPSRFFVQIAQALIKYKEGANNSRLDLEANCTLEMLIKQVNNVVAVDPQISLLWSERDLLSSDSLELANQDEFSVQWLPDVQQKWSSIGYDFFRDGVTGLDEHYFNAQKDRQHLESSLVIPQLKTFSSASRHSSKRVRLG